MWFESCKVWCITMWFKPHTYIAAIIVVPENPKGVVFLLSSTMQNFYLRFLLTWDNNRWTNDQSGKDEGSQFLLCYDQMMVRALDPMCCDWIRGEPECRMRDFANQLRTMVNPENPSGCFVVLNKNGAVARQIWGLSAKIRNQEGELLVNSGVEEGCDWWCLGSSVVEQCLQWRQTSWREEVGDFSSSLGCLHICFFSWEEEGGGGERVGPLTLVDVSRRRRNIGVSSLGLLSEKKNMYEID